MAVVASLMDQLDLAQKEVEFIEFLKSAEALYEKVPADGDCAFWSLYTQKDFDAPEVRDYDGLGKEIKKWRTASRRFFFGIRMLHNYTVQDLVSLLITKQEAHRASTKRAVVWFMFLFSKL